MLSDTRASCMSKIDTNVKAVRMIFILQHHLGFLAQLHHFSCRRLIKQGKGFLMLIRYYHKVPARVGEKVENDKIERSSINYVVLFIGIVCYDLTEDAASLTVDIGNVLIAPRA